MAPIHQINLKRTWKTFSSGINIHHFLESKKKPDVVNFQLHFMIEGNEIPQDSRYLSSDSFQGQQNKNLIIDLVLKISWLHLLFSSF